MLLTLSTTHSPATDLGYLLYKNPARVNRFELTFGVASVFWPEAGADCATAALLVEVDPIALSRRSARDDARPLEPYVNDRPYAASSFLGVAIAEVYGTALSGRCNDRPELVQTAIPLSIGLPVLPCRGGASLLSALFEPLGYTVEATRLPMADLGDSIYFDVKLSGVQRLSEALAHLCVLVPVLDNEKHYWVGNDEVDKLLRRGGDWLPSHPERELITRRYLKNRPGLARAALAQLSADEEAELGEADQAAEAGDAPAEASLPGPTTREAALERSLNLNAVRLKAVHHTLRERGVQRVLDLGCGEGKLTQRLLEDRRFTAITAVDVSPVVLGIAGRRLKLDRLSERDRARLTLMQGSLVYRDARLKGFDGAACVEVVEHLDPWRLSGFSEALFGHARPGLVLLTTPNREYNVLYPGLEGGKLRHSDHRFEWTRAEFVAWATDQAERHRYNVEFVPIGDEHPEHGAPTQMGIFTRCD